MYLLAIHQGPRIGILLTVLQVGKRQVGLFVFMTPESRPRSRVSPNRSRIYYTIILIFLYYPIIIIFLSYTIILIFLYIPNYVNIIIIRIYLSIIGKHR